MVKNASDDAEKILRENMDVFEDWSQDLIENETLDRRQVQDKYLPRLKLPKDLNILKQFDLGPDKKPLQGAQTKMKPS